LKSFLEKYAAEVFDMFEGEWDMDTALKFQKEEGREDGREEGREEGQDTVLELMEQGYNAQQIRDMLAKRQSATSTAQA
jgi:predicted transposase YdaD